MTTHWHCNLKSQSESVLGESLALHLQTHGQLEWQAASGTVTVQRLLLGVSESDRDSDSESS